MYLRKHFSCCYHDVFIASSSSSSLLSSPPCLSLSAVVLLLLLLLSAAGEVGGGGADKMAKEEKNLSQLNRKGGQPSPLSSLNMDDNHYHHHDHDDDEGNDNDALKATEDYEHIQQTTRRRHRNKNKEMKENSGKKYEKNNKLSLKQKTVFKDLSSLEMIPPAQPNISIISANSVLVTWPHPPAHQSHHSLPITFYRIQYRDVNARQKHSQVLWSTVDDDIPASENSFVVKKLKTGSTYLFRLAAVYSNQDNRMSPKSSPFTIQLRDKLKPPIYPPTIVQLKATSPDKLSISWQQNSEPLTGFIIQYRVYSEVRSRPNTNSPDAPTSSKDFMEVKVTNSKKRSATIGGLISSTQYSVRMQSFNKDGRSAPSNTAVAKTLADPSQKNNRQHGHDYDQSPSSSSSLKYQNLDKPLHHAPPDSTTESMVDELRGRLVAVSNEKVLLVIVCSILAFFLLIAGAGLVLLVCFKKERKMFVDHFSKTFCTTQLNGRLTHS